MSNRIELSGFTSKDGAELRVTPSGVTVTTFRMSGTHQRYDQNQAKYVDQGDALWYGVECWRELAEQVAAPGCPLPDVDVAALFVDPAGEAPLTGATGTSATTSPTVLASMMSDLCS